ncbi:MAG: hypothetical protein Q8N47_27955 [Bryobacterales bacterium]|nr:hypothetical protein [Bryobacterales bacterium]
MRTLLLIGLALALSGGQIPRHESEPAPKTLPGGRNQTEAILKVEHQKSLEDAAQLVRLSRQLRAELKKNDRYIVSLGSIKKTEEIEKLARRIRARMRRY